MSFRVLSSLKVPPTVLSDWFHVTSSSQLALEAADKHQTKYLSDNSILLLKYKYLINRNQKGLCVFLSAFDIIKQMCFSYFVMINIRFYNCDKSRLVALLELLNVTLLNDSMCLRV